MSQRSFYASWGCGGGGLVLLSLFLYNRMVVCVLSLFLLRYFLLMVSWVLCRLSSTHSSSHLLSCVYLYFHLVSVCCYYWWCCVSSSSSLSPYTLLITSLLLCPALTCCICLNSPCALSPYLVFIIRRLQCARLFSVHLLWDRVLLETSALFLFYLLSLVRITDSKCWVLCLLSSTHHHTSWSVCISITQAVLLYGIACWIPLLSFSSVCWACLWINVRPFMFLPHPPAHILLSSSLYFFSACFAFVDGEWVITWLNSPRTWARKNTRDLMATPL